jgi:hypothetical protein
MRRAIGPRYRDAWLARPQKYKIGNQVISTRDRDPLLGTTDDVPRSFVFSKPSIEIARALRQIKNAGFSLSASACVNARLIQPFRLRIDVPSPVHR